MSSTHSFTLDGRHCWDADGMEQRSQTPRLKLNVLDSAGSIP